MMTLFDYYKYTVKKLIAAGKDNPEGETRLIFQNILNIKREDFILNKNMPVTPDKCLEIEQVVKQRMDGKPLSKIFGRTEFCGLPIFVTEDTLDPRLDSEVLIQSVFEHFPYAERDLKILDIGTGTGCLVIALLNHYKSAQAIAVDISDKALKIAEKNAATNNVLSRLELQKISWNDLSKLNSCFDLIISNPPYIDIADIKDMDVEVTEHDPHLALFADKKGLKPYIEMANILPAVLKKDGYVFFEIGCEQAGAVCEIYRDIFSFIKLEKDFAGLDRCLVFKNK